MFQKKETIFTDNTRYIIGTNQYVNAEPGAITNQFAFIVYLNFYCSL